MNIVYCDDNRSHLEHFISEFKDLFSKDNLITYDSPEQIISGDYSKTIDVLFLDIELHSDKTGLDYAKILSTLAPTTQIVYITAYTEKYVQEAFLHNENVSGFLIKPVSREQLIKTLAKVRELYFTAKCTLAVKPINKNPLVINQADILYIESQGRKLNIVTHHDTIQILDKLSNLALSLSPCFESCHKSYLINMNYITQMERTTVTLSNQMTLPISASRKTHFIERYIEFCLSKRIK